MPATIPAILSGFNIPDGNITSYGPYSLDDVIERDTLKDIYDCWLSNQEPAYASGEVPRPRVPLCEWCTDIFELPGYWLYASRTTYGSYYGESLLEFGMNTDANYDGKLYTISLTNIRTDMFTSCYGPTLSSVDYTNVVRRDFSKYNEAELAPYLTLSFRLPSWQKLYGTGDDYSASEMSVVGDDDDVSFVNFNSGTTTMDADDANSASGSGSCTGRLTEDGVTAMLRNDLKYWVVLEEREKSLLVAPNDDRTAYRGRYGVAEYTIQTGTLYKRPLYYSGRDNGYWINKGSELARIILKNHEKKTNDVKSTQSTDEQVSKKTERARLINDVMDRWRVALYRKLPGKPTTVLLRPDRNSIYADHPDVIETYDLYHRPLYHSKKHIGYWISEDSNLYDLVRKPNTKVPVHNW